MSNLNNRFSVLSYGELSTKGGCAEEDRTTENPIRKANKKLREIHALKLKPGQRTPEELEKMKQEDHWSAIVQGPPEKEVSRKRRRSEKSQEQIDELAEKEKKRQEALAAAAAVEKQKTLREYLRSNVVCGDAIEERYKKLFLCNLSNDEAFRRISNQYSAKRFSEGKVGSEKTLQEIQTQIQYLQEQYSTFN
jgi:hypothetical protein